MEVELTFPPAKEAAPESEAGEPDAFLAGKHILAAEDNELNAEILQLQFAQPGAQVTMMNNGKQLAESFETASPGAFDMVLTDLMMPELDGYEAARHIRASHRPEGKRIPIIALTADVLS